MPLPSDVPIKTEPLRSWVMLSEPRLPTSEAAPLRFPPTLSDVRLEATVSVPSRFPMMATRPATLVGEIERAGRGRR